MKNNEVVIEKYLEYSPGHFVLREALPKNDPDNLWNWFKAKYPDLQQEDYGIENPFGDINYSW